MHIKSYSHDLSVTIINCSTTSILASVTHVIIIHGLCSCLVINIVHTILILFLPFLASSTLFTLLLFTIVKPAPSYLNWNGLVVI